MERVKIEKTEKNFATDLRQLVTDLGLGNQVGIDSKPCRSGGIRIIFAGKREISAAWGSGLDQIENAKYSLLIKLIARSLACGERSVSSGDLLEKESFRDACVTEVQLSEPSKGNEFLSSLTEVDDARIPFFYGSTDGLNFAELLETVLTARYLESRGLDATVIFDTAGNDSKRSRQMLSESISVLPYELRQEFFNFLKSIGDTLQEQRISAAKGLLPNTNLRILPAEQIFDALGKKLTVGKLAVLAKIAGEDPQLFQGVRVSELLASTNQSREGLQLLKTLVSETGLQPAGFTYYARDAVIAAEFRGIVGFPFKLTDHANIYKILDGYSALYSPSKGSGAILCPIQRQRIQTRSQSQEGADPFDVTALFFLSQKFPEEFHLLIEDFTLSTRILTPTEAIGIGNKDKRFIIEDYFFRS